MEMQDEWHANSIVLKKCNVKDWYKSFNFCNVDNIRSQGTGTENEVGGQQLTQVHLVKLPQNWNRWTWNVLWIANHMYYLSACPAAKSYTFCFWFLFICLLLMNPVRPIMSKSTKLIFAKFSGFAEPWECTISLISVFWSIEWHCHGNQCLLVSSTEMVFVMPVASGTARRGNVALCSAPSGSCLTHCIISALSRFGPPWLSVTIMKPWYRCIQLVCAVNASHLTRPNYTPQFRCGRLQASPGSLSAERVSVASQSVFSRCR